MQAYDHLVAAIATGNAQFAGLLCSLLKLVGLGAVEQIEDALTAAGAARIKQCDLLVMSVDAAGMTLIHVARRNPISPNPYIPILAVGMDMTKADVTAAIGFGAHDVLVLPASVKQIRTRLERAVLCGRP